MNHVEDMSDLDEIFLSYITREMFMSPMVSWTRITQYISYVQFIDEGNFVRLYDILVTWITMMYC